MKNDLIPVFPTRIFCACFLFFLVFEEIRLFGVRPDPVEQVHDPERAGGGRGLALLQEVEDEQPLHEAQLAVRVLAGARAALRRAHVHRLAVRPRVAVEALVAERALALAALDVKTNVKTKLWLDVKVVVTLKYMHSLRPSASL